MRHPAAHPAGRSHQRATDSASQGGFEINPAASDHSRVPGHQIGGPHPLHPTGRTAFSGTEALAAANVIGLDRIRHTDIRPSRSLCSVGGRDLRCSLH